MKTYTIPCHWEQWGEIEVKAFSLAKAESITLYNATKIPDEECLQRASFEIIEKDAGVTFLCKECEALEESK